MSEERPFHHGTPCRYIVGGWRIRSAFELPGLCPLPTGAPEWRALPDIEFASGPVEETLPDDRARDHPVFAVDGAGTVLLRLPGTLRIRIEGGRRATVQILTGVPSPSLGMLLRGPVLAVLARQRGLVPFQGSALRFGDRAFAVIGPTGTGKSALAAMLARRGGSVLADGLCPVSVAAGGIGLLPFIPALRLWRHTVEALGLDGFRIVPRPGTGFGFAQFGTAAPAPGILPLAGLLVLSPNPALPEGGMPARVPPAAALAHLLAALAAGPALTDGPGGRALAGLLARIVGAGITLVARAAGDWTTGGRLADAILEQADVAGGGDDGRW